MKYKNYISLIFIIVVIITVDIYTHNTQKNITALEKKLPPRNSASNPSIGMPHNETNNNKKDNPSKKEKIIDCEPMTLAIFGSDEREDEISRSDVIMVLKYEPLNQKVIMISVPRDSRVEIPGKGVTKINAAYAYGGADLQIKTLEDLFHTTIDHYIHLNFVGFINIIDAIGGVKINAKKNFYDEDNPTQIYIKKGKITLDGEKLLRYVRFRDDEEGDFGRIKRQQEVIASICKKFIKDNTWTKIPKFIDIFKNNIDSNIDWKEIIDVAWNMKDIKSINIEAYTLKTHSKIIQNSWFEIIDESSLNELSHKLK